ncbi:MAG: hypothetical protein SGARI_002249 [Bacillariaceae sp.]
MNEKGQIVVLGNINRSNVREIQPCVKGTMNVLLATRSFATSRQILFVRNSLYTALGARSRETSPGNELKSRSSSGSRRTPIIRMVPNGLTHQFFLFRAVKWLGSVHKIQHVVHISIPKPHGVGHTLTKGQVLRFEVANEIQHNWYYPSDPYHIP